MDTKINPHQYSALLREITLRMEKNIGPAVDNFSVATIALMGTEIHYCISEDLVHCIPEIIDNLQHMYNSVIHYQEENHEIQ